MTAKKTHSQIIRWRIKGTSLFKRVKIPKPYKKMTRREKRELWAKIEREILSLDWGPAGQDIQVELWDKGGKLLDEHTIPIPAKDNRPKEIPETHEHEWIPYRVSSYQGGRKWTDICWCGARRQSGNSPDTGYWERIDYPYGPYPWKKYLFYSFHKPK